MTQPTRTRRALLLVLSAVTVAALLVWLVLGGVRPQAPPAAAPLPVLVEPSALVAAPEGDPVALPPVVDGVEPPPPVAEPVPGSSSDPVQESAPSTGSAGVPGVPGGGSKASQVLALVNTERTAAGCGPVRRDGRLESAASAHSADMAANDYFSHDSQDGRSFGDRVRAAGYAGGAVAENIAAGQTSAAGVVKEWMASAGHRANILNCSFTDMGVGYATGGSFGSYWTQDLGG